MSSDPQKPRPCLKSSKTFPSHLDLSRYLSAVCGWSWDLVAGVDAIISQRNLHDVKPHTCAYFSHCLHPLKEELWFWEQGAASCKNGSRGVVELVRRDWRPFYCVDWPQETLNILQQPRDWIQDKTQMSSQMISQNKSFCGVYNPQKNVFTFLQLLYSKCKLMVKIKKEVILGPKHHMELEFHGSTNMSN